MRKTPLVPRSSLRRSAPRPWRRAEDDKVGPEEAAHVLKRDGGCIVPRVDPEAWPCSGRITLDHVQEDYGKMGDRAKSDRYHLVSVCEGHSEKGMRAGRQWNTSKEGRRHEREYLAKHESR